MDMGVGKMNSHRLSPLDVQHVSTVETYHVVHDGKKYVVRKEDLWGDGEQNWFVKTFDEWSEVKGDLRHIIVREVQEFLLWR